MPVKAFAPEIEMPNYDSFLINEEKPNLPNNWTSLIHQGVGRGVQMQKVDVKQTKDDTDIEVEEAEVADVSLEIPQAKQACDDKSQTNAQAFNKDDLLRKLDEFL